MAQNLLCDLCQQEPAQLMQTNIDNGQVITVGASCMLLFLLTTAETIVSDMPPEVAAQYGETVASIVDKLSDRVIAIALDEDPTTGDMVPLIDASEATTPSAAETANNLAVGAQAAAKRAAKGA